MSPERLTPEEIARLDPVKLRQSQERLLRSDRERRAEAEQRRVEERWRNWREGYVAGRRTAARYAALYFDELAITLGCIEASSGEPALRPVCALLRAATRCHRIARGEPAFQPRAEYTAEEIAAACALVPRLEEQR